MTNLKFCHCEEAKPTKQTSMLDKRSIKPNILPFANALYARIGETRASIAAAIANSLRSAPVSPTSISPTGAPPW